MLIPRLDIGLFSMVYLGSALGAIAYLYRVGVKRGYPLSSWMITVATVSVLFLTGTRIFSLSAYQFTSMITSGSIPEEPLTRSALGGFMLGMLGLLVMKRIFHFGGEVFDHYAVIIPLLYGLQKIGCLFASCCYGTESTLPWAIQYSQHAPGLHPVQAYEALLIFLIPVITMLLRNRLRLPGERLILTMLLFLIFRAFAEFFRAPEATQIGAATLAGIKVIQWTLILLAILCGFGWAWYRKQSRTPAGHPVIRQSPVAGIAVILPPVFLIFMTRELYSHLEILRLTIIFSMIVIVYGVELARSIRQPALRYSLLSLIVIGGGVLTSQTIKPESSPGSENEKTLEIGFGYGQFINEIGSNPHESSCGTAYDHNYYEQRYESLGLEYRVKKPSDTPWHTTLGIGGYLGVLHEKPYDLATGVRGESVNRPMISVNPFIEISNPKWLGLRLGVHAGYNRYLILNTDKTQFSEGSLFFPILPNGSIRLGPLRYFFIEYNALNQFPNPFPANVNTFYAGSGFGTTNMSLRVGVTEKLDDLITEVRFPLNSFRVRAALSFGKNYYDEDKQNLQVSFGLGYSLGKGKNAVK